MLKITRDGDDDGCENSDSIVNADDMCDQDERDVDETTYEREHCGRRLL